MSNLGLAASYDPKTITTFIDIDFKEEVTPQTLILMAIDNTIMTSHNPNYGSIEYFEWLIKERMEEKNYPYKRAMRDVYYKWIDSQIVAKTKIIDTYLPQIIEQIKQNEGTLIAFTSRQPNIANITKKQLVWRNIKLDLLKGLKFTKTFDQQISPDREWCLKRINYPKCKDRINIEKAKAKATFYKGILFAHDYNEKGLVFKEFLPILNQHRNAQNLPEINKIIYIDSNNKHLDSMAKTLEELNLNSKLYHFEYKNIFDPKVAKLFMDTMR
jgi:hypothetical protein